MQFIINKNDFVECPEKKDPLSSFVIFADDTQIIFLLAENTQWSSDESI